MTATHPALAGTPDWNRSSAIAATLAAHLAAALLVFAPAAVVLERHLPDVVPAVVLLDPPASIEPIPPEPQPPQQHRREPLQQPTQATPPPVAPRPDDAPVATTPVPVAATAPATMTRDAPAAAPGIGPASGASRTLAYDGPVELRYPRAALRQREEGTVLLSVLVDAQGRVQRIEIARSSGHARLDAAAREAVARARFKPVLQAGVAVAAWGMVPVAFRLDRG
jgi:protein TonB